MESAILLVEDDPSVRHVLVRFLGRSGFRVVTATSGVEALEKLDSYGPLNVVISDMIMPGISGMDFVLRLQKQRPGLPFLLITGWTDHPALNDVAARTLMKPFAMDDLVSAISEVASVG